MKEVFVEPIKKLSQPMAYLRISHPEKRFFDWYLPLVFSILATLIFIYSRANIVQQPGVIPAICDLQKILIGFYIASLSAIANYKGENLDQLIAGGAPTLKENNYGEEQEVELTRRRFLCYLFGYLAFLSFTLYCIGSLIQIIYPKISVLLTGYSWFLLAKYIVCFIYLIAFFQLLFTTFLGLYYMSYRIHIPEPKKTDGDTKK